jgi:hypothetical protein
MQGHHCVVSLRSLPPLLACAPATHLYPFVRSFVPSSMYSVLHYLLGAAGGREAAAEQRKAIIVTDSLLSFFQWRPNCRSASSVSGFGQLRQRGTVACSHCQTSGSCSCIDTLFTTRPSPSYANRYCRCHRQRKVASVLHGAQPQHKQERITRENHVCHRNTA